MGGGRKLEFDKQQALEQAMYTFWKKGYSAASLTDLTASMGINKPSLYATFGNKEQLFISATDYYLEYHAKPHIQWLHAAGHSLKDRLIKYLLSICSVQFAPQTPQGCYISCCASEGAGGTIPKDALDSITKASEFSENYLEQFFKDEIKQGNLRDISAKTAALFIITLLHGTASMARTGKFLKDIKSVILFAINSLDL